jgi:single-strand DNA-binding protein
MNKVMLYGHVGKDPDIKTLESGKKIAKFSLATSKKIKDNDVTQWHNIIFWDKQAEVIEKYVKKGSSLIIEGEIQYREYEDKEGVKKYFTEILGNSFYFTGKKEDKPVEKKEEFKANPKAGFSDINELPGVNDNDDSLPF